MSLIEKAKRALGFGSEAPAPARTTVATATREPGPQIHVDLARYERDSAAVRKYLPSGTKENEINGTVYWTYSVRCQLDRDYVMTVYFDGREYQVRVLQPDVVKKYNVHDAHVFENGRLCLEPPSNGAKSLRDAYSKSVIWATGFSILQETGQFPFTKA